jgi:hypothetical protein
MSIKTPTDSDALERFTAKERDLIRREFMVRWGGFRSLHEGLFLHRWAGGPHKGTPKVRPTVGSMLARGLVEIDDPEPSSPSARFTPAGVAALRAMAKNRQVLAPDQYGHLIEELRTFPDPQSRRKRAPKADARSERVSEAPRKPQGAPRPRPAAQRPPKARVKEVWPVENPAFQEAFESLFSGIFDREPAQTAEIIPFPTPSPAAKKPKPRR